MSSNNPGGIAGPGIGSILPPTTPATPSPGIFSTVGAVAVDTLKLAVHYAASPEGMAVLVGILGATNPVIGLIAQFGVRALSGIFSTLPAGTVTLSDADIQAMLAKGGVRVEPYDPTTMFSGA
jgi:uncharacterized membrane protein